MTTTLIDRERAGFCLLEHLAQVHQREWIALRVEGDISWNTVRPRTEGALLNACETEGVGKKALRERIARAMIVPLGFSPDVDWERTWVGNQCDNIETGSLAYLCRALADAALASTDTRAETPAPPSHTGSDRG